MEVWVTFDSNVWESIVDENKRANSAEVYSQLFHLIQSKIITPFFFEGIATIETMKKSERKPYIANFKGAYSITVDGQEISSSKGSKAPELTEYLASMIPKALELGFRFTKLPRVGAPALEFDKKYLAPDVKHDLGDRLERSFECLRFIESLGAGRSHLMNQLPRVDGDALAASYGYDIDYFCTNDRASSAGQTSIFYHENLKKLESNYPVNVITPEDLASKFK